MAAGTRSTPKPETPVPDEPAVASLEAAALASLVERVDGIESTIDRLELQLGSLRAELLEGAAAPAASAAGSPGDVETALAVARYAIQCVRITAGTVARATGVEVNLPPTPAGV